MIIQDLLDIILRLRMADKERSSDILFDCGAADGIFRINSVYLDEDGDLCLESTMDPDKGVTISEIAETIAQYDRGTTVYFLLVGPDGEKTIFNIKDGGTPDKDSPELKLIRVGRFREAIQGLAPGSCLHLESGSINFTVNSVYFDDDGLVCLESNEIMELDDYLIGDLLEELAPLEDTQRIYFYDDDSQEYYGIYPDELRLDAQGDVWIKIR